MREALDKVKADLGRNAVILHTKSFTRGGFLGIGGREMIEITASDDVRVITRTAKREAPPPKRGPASALLESIYKTAAPPDMPAATPQPLAGVALNSIEAEVGNIKLLVSDLVRREHRKALKNCADQFIDLYDALLRRGVEENAARSVVQKVRDSAAGNGSADGATDQQMISRMLRVAGPIVRGEKSARTVALVGPTGVGKTTTIAKLAANFKLREKLDVGLITIDTYRIAAVQQLKTYADIIGIPLNIVLTPEELAGALEAFSGKDIVLVDTAGRSQCDAQKMQELKAFLDAGKFDEVHLVVSATTHTAHLDSIVERFGPLSHDRMILTKIDESPCRGHVLNVLLRVNKAASYVTTGQEVPDDIEVADAGKISAIIMRA
jgi:flagellar biosynthesis protein FlhF